MRQIKNSCVQFLPQHNNKLHVLYCYHYAHKLKIHVFQKKKKQKSSSFLKNGHFKMSDFENLKILFIFMFENLEINICNIRKKTMKPLNFLYCALPFAGFYVAVAVAHYYSAHAYTWYCTPLGWYGLSISPFIVTTPHCKALRWSIQHFSTNIESMWTILGTWIITKLIR